jgi:hypothetical protein
MDPKALNSQFFFYNYKSKLPVSLLEDKFLNRFQYIYENVVDQALFRMRRECRQFVSTSENN